jgi:hypothetical protein
MNILEKLANLQAVTSSTQVAKKEMTPAQVLDCKAAIKAKNRGYNVQPNKFDISNPYRVAINYNNVWQNYGDFASADVAAAIGTIVSAAYFGDRAKLGNFDNEVAQKDPNFVAWLADPRNADVLARAEDSANCYFKTGEQPVKVAKNDTTDDIPF